VARVSAVSETDKAVLPPQLDIEHETGPEFRHERAAFDRKPKEHDVSGGKKWTYFRGLGGKRPGVSGLIKHGKPRVEWINAGPELSLSGRSP